MIGGGFLLMLPIARTGGGITPPLIAFFTSVSAVSTTGLTLVTTATYWTPFGQAVICGLIFLGGLGLVTAVMFIMWLRGVRFTLHDRFLTREAMASGQLGGLLRLLRNVVLLDISITIIGALLNILPFQHYYTQGTALWPALFHSVSSFNTAGFDIVGSTSFVPFRNDTILLSIATIEAVLGAIGFSVLLEVPKVHKFNRFSLDTKLVLVTTITLYLLGTIGMFIAEYFHGASLTDFSFGGKIFTTFFNALSASTTTGYATINFGQITIQTLIIIVVLMFVGASTGSTGGGIKVNTFAIMMATVWSTLRGRKNTESFGREISHGQVLRATIVVVASLIVVVIAVILIMASSPTIPFERVLFEVTSAFGTVGLSTEALANFSPLGQVVIIFVMFIGRVTPLSVVMIFARRKPYPLYRFPREGILMG
ncbi:MAG: hypothetical protein JW856_04370 [Dehalococcoidales bacterium]|nr:hypothetical protein [Dehalococcoidales bacterium]